MNAYKPRRWMKTYEITMSVEIESDEEIKGDEPFVKKALIEEARKNGNKKVQVIGRRL